MKKRIPKSFDELIKNHYGTSCHTSVSNTVKAERLFANYYGKPIGKGKRRKAPSVVLSLSYDSGEMLAQKSKDEPFEEYVVQQSATETPFEEYVVADRGTWTERSVATSLQVPSSEEVSPWQEYQADLLRPLNSSGTSGSRTTASPRREPSYTASTDRGPRETYPARSPHFANETTQAKASEDDFIADMQSILSGQMVFDPVTKKTVAKEDLNRNASSNSGDSSGRPLPEAKNEQAIFDRIAQSMEYANKYDLGTVELENRFSDFDRISELQEKAKGTKSKNGRAPYAQSSPAPTIDSSDFIQDLETIRKGDATPSSPSPTARAVSMSLEKRLQGRNRDAACTTMALSLSASNYSRPFYDTGEHVLTGGDLYPDQLRVGKIPGISFSYGQLIAMGDLYASVDEMMGAEPNELTNLKTLIERDTEYYKTNKTNKKLSVANKEWNDATSKRFLKLAAENYEHFSPNVLFKDAIAKAANKHGNNKTTWEHHHKWAIEEAQKLFLAPENKNRTAFPEWPLIINAFGDHFLTDAFASGHLINKEVTIAYFQANFFTSSGSLKPAAEKFFERVAELSWGEWWQMTDVRRKFSVLETTSYPVCAAGWCLKWHPNIDSANMFRKLLVEAATQQPEKVANFAVKALHDRLNEDGIEVFNNAGDIPWTLTGDDFLNPTSLAIIRKAVQQSVDNINDPSIYADNLDFDTYFSKVWKYVPQLTEASQKKMASLTQEYTKPDSMVLSTAAAKIITEQVDQLIDVLVNDEKKLQHE
jgi:hypothetical protein